MRLERSNAVLLDLVIKIWTAGSPVSEAEAAIDDAKTDVILHIQGRDCSYHQIKKSI